MSEREYICPIGCFQCPIEDCAPNRLRKLVEYKQMSSLWHDGVTMADVADRCGVQRKTVSKAVDAYREGKLTNIPLMET